MKVLVLRFLKLLYCRKQLNSCIDTPDLWGEMMLQSVLYGVPNALDPSVPSRLVVQEVSINDTSCGGWKLKLFSMFEEMHDAELDDRHLKALRPYVLAAGIIRLMMLGSSRCTCSLALVPAEPGQESECTVFIVMWCLAD
jgi:hypothetical protein